MLFRHSVLLPFLSVAGGVLADGDLDYDVLQYIDPLIGSAEGVVDRLGNVFAGASIPYGMAKAVADTDSINNQGGFAFDGSNVTGFSSLHDSGTGGQPSLGNFPIFPYRKCANDDINGCVYPKKERKTGYIKETVTASPGYFGLELDTGVLVDMTVTHHASIFRFRFPGDNSSSPLLLLDLSDLSDSRQDNGTISVDPETGRMMGHARFLPSFGSGSYVPYFCADFQGDAGLRDTGIFVNSRASTDVKNLTISRSVDGYPLPGGAFVRFHGFDDQTISARVGLSFLSSEKACANAEKEIPGFNFVGTHSGAVNLWTKMLSPIRVERKGVNTSMLTNFYSGIYRTMINPQDYTNENPLWNSTQPYFDSFYWYLLLFSSVMLIANKSVSRMVASLIDTQKHLGWLPDCRMSFCKGYTQGGSNADVVLADAYLKQLKDGIDWDAGYEAVRKDATEEPFDWLSQGRGGLASWNKLHYIPMEDFDPVGFGPMTRTISRTVEYAYNDFAVAQMARGMNKTGDAERFERSAGNWRNLFRYDQKSFINGTDTGFVGFFQPRYLNGTWGYQDPLACSDIDINNTPCSVHNNPEETFEGSIWEYQFFVPHDMKALITTLGGPTAFTKRLDYLHDNKIAYIGNEPSFLTVFQYHYAGRPALSTLRARSYIPSSFAPTPTGLPGNDDSGAMGSFMAMAMMGLFPNPGQDVYLISTPFFPSVRITSPVTGNSAVVTAEGFEAGNEKKVFIQKALLNGRPYTRNWIEHQFFLDGGELILFLGDEESDWGTGEDDVPPSISS